MLPLPKLAQMKKTSSHKVTVSASSKDVGAVIRMPSLDRELLNMEKNRPTSQRARDRDVDEA